MASTQGSGTQADPYTRWEGGILEWRGLSEKYVAFGAYINMYPDSYDEMERYIVGVSGGGLSNPSLALRGTTSQSGTVSVTAEEYFGPDPGEYHDRWTFYFTVLSPSYTVSVYSAGGGTVSGGGTYTEGSTATITATPSTGYHFTNWSDGDTNASRSFQVWGNVSLTAYFAINTYTVTLYSNGGGSVSGGGTYNYGATATITGTPDTGFYFSNWSDGNTSASRSFTVTGNVTLVAYFNRITYTVAVSSAGGGTVSGGGTYNYGSIATITATPSAHYHFTNWSDGNTSASRSFTVTGNVSLTAYFAIDTHTVTLTSNGNGSVSGGGTYNYGASCTITATPDTNYKFVQWSDGNTNASRTFTVTGDVSLSATFALAVAKTNVKVNGVWTQGSVYVKVNGSWVESKKIYVKVNGDWVEGS